MIQIVSKNKHDSEYFAAGKPFRHIADAKDLFGHTNQPLYVLHGWKDNRSRCNVNKISAMIKAYEVLQYATVYRYDKPKGA